MPARVTQMTPLCYLFGEGPRNGRGSQARDPVAQRGESCYRPGMNEASTPQESVIILGASPERSRFSNKALRCYRDLGYRVFPVHPTARSIERDVVYPKLAALPEPSSTPDHPARTFVAPRTPVEETLAEIWKAVLPVELIGVHDGFLHLGGDSLAATRIVSRINDAFGTDLFLRALFDAPAAEPERLAFAGVAFGL